ncbi:MAG: LysM peptidoglycan-binding domain-containing protein [Planctomycetota bacterium]
MGSFEKLGILVIVIIIVMILVVAIYQWGGAEFELAPEALRVPYTGPALVEGMNRPTETDLEGLINAERRRRGELGRDAGETASEDEESARSRRGVPEVYRVQRNDSAWKLCRRWGLKDSFIQRIAAANPKVRIRLLQVGQLLVIPNPDGYFRGSSRSKSKPRAKTGHRTYRVKEGDSFWTIAKHQLGDAMRGNEIQNLNPRVSPKRMRPGMVLKIPLR